MSAPESFSERVLTDARFWAQVVTDSERTWLCTPDMESRVVGLVRTYGMDGVITVVASPLCPDGQVLVLDHHGIEADWRQLLARPIEMPRWPTRERTLMAQYLWYGDLVPRPACPTMYTRAAS